MAVGDLVVERFFAVVMAFGTNAGAPNSVEGEVRAGGEDGRIRIPDDQKEREVISGKEARIEALRRALEVVSVPCSVRQGSRMSRKSSRLPSQSNCLSCILIKYSFLHLHTEKQLSTLASELPVLLLKLQSIHIQSWPEAQSLTPALLRCTTAILTAGDMALWLGPGRKILAQSWDALGPAFGASLHGALAEKELGWGGWKAVGLQGVLKVSAAATGMGVEENMVGLLAELVRDGRIGAGDVDAVWKERIGKWAGNRLGCWEMVKNGNGEAGAEELTDTLSLAPFIPSLHTHLIKIISRTLNTPQTRTEIELEYTATHANVTWVLGLCLHALARTMTTGSSAQVKEVYERIDLARWVEKVVGKWPWSGWVLSGLVSVVKAKFVLPCALCDLFT